MKQILYFTAGWCPSCQNMTPIVEQLKRTHSIPVQKIDIDYDGTYVPKYDVKSVSFLGNDGGNAKYISDFSIIIPSINNSQILRKNALRSSVVSNAGG